MHVPVLVVGDIVSTYDVIHDVQFVRDTVQVEHGCLQG